jgi:hypothetical protein
VYYIDRLYVRRVVLTSWTFSIVSTQLILSSSSFLLIFFLATESGALLYDVSEGFGGKERKIMEAYGRIANNQLQIDGLISWIQSGLWYLTVSYNDTDRSKNAYFYTDFKMVRPDGSTLHEHSIKNFKSTNVVTENEKIIVNGIADIYSGESLNYNEIPIIVDLKNNTVLGLTIDEDRTQKHFASSINNEMLGILIESRSFSRTLS